MNYTFNQLQIFLKVASLKSITKAAEELNLTQPAVSIQLKNFQDQFDSPLTEVVGRKLYLTDFGYEIMEEVERVIEASEKLNYKSVANRGKLVGKLKITGVSSSKYLIPYFLTKFIEKNNLIELVIDVTNRANVVESLSKNEVDFAVVSVLPEHFQVESYELLENKMYLVGKPNSKFNGQTFDKTILNSLPIIYREKGSATRITMEAFIKNNNLIANKRLEMSSNEAVKQALIAGLGYSLMPLIGIKNEISNGSLQIINIKGLPITTNWQLIWMKNKRFTPIMEAYFSFLQNEKANIILEYFSWVK
jgi:LysR family transcriptional regulator, low CO2-responsive transcriptional regulator